jgi:hypothetical protein
MKMPTKLAQDYCIYVLQIILLKTQHFIKAVRL